MELTRMKSPDDFWYPQAMELYRISFPLHEQRTQEAQERALADPCFHCDAIVEDDAFLGLLFFWEADSFAYVEHFAMDPARRGGGQGTQALTLFCRTHPKVILEIDPPVDELSLRRRGFYQRLGFAEYPYPHRHPAYRTAFAPHPLVVMSRPTVLSQVDYTHFYRVLSTQVMAYGEA